MKHRPRKHGELFWNKIFLRKWLNYSTRDSDFSADESDTESQLHDEENVSDNAPKLQRRNSETRRVQYIRTKELRHLTICYRICVGTWNVGGKLPPDDIDINEWLNKEDPADVYVLGLYSQIETVPLNAGNIFGIEDDRSIPIWESAIRQTLNSTPSVVEKVKCYSDPPSPSRFQASNDMPSVADEMYPGIDSESNDEEVHLLVGQSYNFQGNAIPSIALQDASYSHHGDVGASTVPDKEIDFSPRRVNRLSSFSTVENEVNAEAYVVRQRSMVRTLSNSERIGLSWPEKPLDLVSQCVSGSMDSFKSVGSLRSWHSFKSAHAGSDIGSSLGQRLDSVMSKRKRSRFVRIISKQMVGLYMSVWVRRSLRRHVQNLKVSTVGVGIMGYIGNKVSPILDPISVSMSIYQTLFCFICIRRNSDVQEIYRRTLFHSDRSTNLPRTIHDHERIIWLGDLNYRINLSYNKTENSSPNENGQAGSDGSDNLGFSLSHQSIMWQLKQELKEGRSFDGWSEGVLDFPPTYKYELNSDKYFGEDPKMGRRTPAWCDRILSFGRGLRLLSYSRVELKLSDHRPVRAILRPRRL
ncbi:unnamed protein product [Spirodela intermedia]|uniref:Inositol polyphosphate-related phosphatase domain-containing protein n=1 Tax=Spirodela intermedia TaxID=51605 RepID=A0A7I8IV48_SPIIN|nr:unnamed protein product [Spirodela intermedia]CAA6660862.1 unnamed protein product [Spirodela intermedia]